MDTEAYELELVQKATAGDTAALTVLLAEAYGRVHTRVARRIPADLRGSVDADDVLQEAQVEAYLHIDEFVPQGPESFQRWVSTIAIRRLRNAIKKRRALKRGGDKVAMTTVSGAFESSVVALLDLMAGPAGTPSRCAATHEAVAALEAALAQLPEDYRRVVQLVYIEQQPVSTVAAQMGRTDRAIHNLCFKAKAHLRDLLGSGSHYLSGWG